MNYKLLLLLELALVGALQVEQGHVSTASVQDVGTARFAPPTLISTHHGRSDADTFISGFAENPDVVIGSTHVGNSVITVQSFDGGLTWSDAWAGGLMVGQAYGVVNGNLQSVGNVSRYNFPPVSRILGNEFTTLRLITEANGSARISKAQHCGRFPCDAAHHISWVNFPSPTLQVTLYSGNIVSLHDGTFGKTMVGCDAARSPTRPFGCNLVPHHEHGHMVWGASNHSVWWFKSRDGVHWRFVSVIANSSRCHGLGIATEEGPNEVAVTLLADGRSLIAVMRRDGGDGDPHKYHRSYLKSISTDNGDSWSNPAPMPRDILSARPMIARVPFGASKHVSKHVALVLTGGRPGLNVWVNWKGDGEDWQTFNLAALHNQHVKRGGHTFCDDYVHQNVSATFHVSQSSAYNSVVRIGQTTSGDGRALVCYPLGGSDLQPPGEPTADASCYSNYTRVYCMQMVLS